MTASIVLQFVVVLAAIWMGARYSGVGLGLWGHWDSPGAALLVIGRRLRTDRSARQHGRCGEQEHQAAMGSADHGRSQSVSWAP